MMLQSIIVLDIEKMPRIIFAMRKQLSDLLREVALDEPPQVAKRLQEIAAVFEVGDAP